MSASPNLKLPFIDANQNQKSVTHNAALTILDALVNCQARSAALAAPPASPADGQCWIVAAGGSGAWAGKDFNIAAWQDGAWNFYAPTIGMLAYDDATGSPIVWTGAAWSALAGGGGGGGAVTSVAGRTGAVTLAVADVSGAAPLASPALTGTPTAPTQAASDNSMKLATTGFVAASFLLASNAPALGIGTAADSGNPLSTKLNSALFTALPTSASGTGDVRVKLSKQAAGNTASFLFQDNFSGRAEIGLCGDANFHFKVSADGSTWYDALDIAAATGAVSFLSPPIFPTPTAGDSTTKGATTAFVATAVSAAFARTQVNDAAYAVQATDRTAAVIALTAARTLTLPAASAYPSGATLTIVDESGACSATNAITVARSGTDTINGATSATIASPYGYLSLDSNTSNKWTIVDGPSGIVSSLNGGPLAGFRNRIINANFAVNQRAYASGTALAAGSYAHDRWRAGASGCTYAFTTAKPDTTITISAGTLLQVVEDANLEGGTYMLSWTGTATARAYQGSASGSYAASPLVLTGVAAGTATTIEFSTGSLGRVQLEPGPVVTPFERRPVGAELALCQRYYWRRNSVGTVDVLGMAQAYAPTAVFGCVLQLPVPMRATPGLNVSSAAHIGGFTAGGSGPYAFGSGGTAYASPSGFGFNLSGAAAASFVAGNAVMVCFNTASAWVDASAEL